MVAVPEDVDQVIWQGHIHRPLIVGLIGGIASGKSTVARLLSERGALWLDSDRMAHQVLASSDVIALISSRFGKDVLASNGQVDRSQLAMKVFGVEPQALANKRWLEELIHPRVRAMNERLIEQDAGAHAVVIIDAPLLIEAGWVERCQRILMVDAPLEQRQLRAAHRGWSAAQLAEREAAQLSISEKKQQATDVLTNAGSLADLELQVDRFYRSLAIAD